MKNRISRILGVGLTVAVLASLLIAGPAAAGTLSWTAEGIPSATGYVIATGSNVVDIAAGTGGNPIYAATGTAALYKSTNVGVSWTKITTANATNLVAVAPDDGNVVAYADTATDNVFLATDGGTTFNLLTFGIANIKSIDISAAVSGVRQVVAAGDDGAGNAIAVSINWGAYPPVYTTITGNAGFATNSTSILAVEFSPNFVSDRVMLAVTVNSTPSTQLQAYSFASSTWNANASGFLGYPGTITAGAPTGADIALPPAYVGVDPASRVSYIALAGGTLGGIYRMTDLSVTKLAGGTAGIDFRSVAVSADRLVAGASASNGVYSCATPATATAATQGVSYKQPGVNGLSTSVVVAYAGTQLVAGTSGSESAFSVSTDGGLNFNDISLIDTTLAIDDFSVTADGNTVYIVQDTGAGYSCLWRKNAAGWARIFDAAGSDYITRMTSDNVVWMALKGFTDMYYSTTGGETGWTYRIAPANIGDLALESATVLYVGTTTGGVAKSTDAGFIWGAATATGAAGINSLVSMGAGNLVAGGTDGKVSYAINGTWTALAAPAVAAVKVTADKVATGGYIYAGSDASDQLYSWKIDAATVAWVAMRTTTDASYDVTGIGLSGGTLYAVANNGTASELIRTLSPSAIVAASDASFSVIPNTSYVLNGLVISGGPKLWSKTAAALYSFTDTLAAAGPTLVEPADKFRIQVNPQTGIAATVIFTWNQISTASGYDIQIALDSAFTKMVLADVKSYASTPVVYTYAGANLMPGTTYYWRVRATAPAYTPWSATRAFTVNGVEAFKIVGPTVGATSVEVFPTFSWSPFEGAIGYEIMVAEDPTFAIIDFSRSTTQTFFKAEEQLAYNTTYYWRVRGVTGAAPPKEPAPGGPWQNGIFTTAARPVAEQPVVITVPGPTQPAQIIEVPVQTPAPIPSYLLWAIIGIGAILLIALIILIVRTRRVS